MEKFSLEFFSFGSTVSNSLFAISVLPAGILFLYQPLARADAGRASPVRVRMGAANSFRAARRVGVGSIDLYARSPGTGRGMY